MNASSDCSALNSIISSRIMEVVDTLGFDGKKCFVKCSSVRGRP